MKITELLNNQSIELHSQVKGKKEAIEQLLGLMEKSGNIQNMQEYKNAVLNREKEGSTGIGEGIAIPHGKSNGVKKPGLAAMVVPEGVDFDSLDGRPATLLFLIAAPDTKDNVHLEVLSRLSKLLMNETFTDALRNAKTNEEFLNIIDQADSEDDSEKSAVQQNTGYKILAVTACPTGIAHTYMAAQSLENKAKELGVSMKVETNGSVGAKNVLTKDEITKADCIIISADRNVEMARFEGKPLIKTKVADGIHKPGDLIEQALNGEAKIYHHEGREDEKETEESKSIGRQIYKHLMNGVSHMLPFVIGGGILIAIAFLVDDYSINPANFGKNTLLAAFFKTAGEKAFGFMLPILAGFIAMSIGDRPGLAIGFVGGAIASAGITFGNLAGGDFSAGFLGALIAGFIGGYIIVFLRKLFGFLPDSLEGIKPVLLYPVAGLLLIAFIMIGINPIIGAINNALNFYLNSMSGTSRIILGAILGGMMSVDLGGPVNKAAYVFGTAQLAEGEFGIMAAVMVGGMVPPLVIALCATFFPNKFPRKERQSALVNYIMGLSFISEGAIPFAAADPIRVLPSCIIGSAIAGALSMAFGCQLRAPHGGIFVFPVVSNWLGYLIALAVGSLVGALILAALKKRVENAK